MEKWDAVGCGGGGRAGLLVQLISGVVALAADNRDEVLKLQVSQ